MSEWYPDEEPLDPSVFAVTGVVLLATVLFATYTYWDGYAAGRCYQECRGQAATLWPDGSCSCGKDGVGTVP